jgi:hypothetical protein
MRDLFHLKIINFFKGVGDLKVIWWIFIGVFLVLIWMGLVIYCGGGIIDFIKVDKFINKFISFFTLKDFILAFFFIDFGKVMVFV